jgi:hypothetical protein
MPETIGTARRWRRFAPRMSLRVLAVLILIVGVWLARVEHRARIRLQATEAVRGIGERITFDDQGPNGVAIPSARSWVPG